MINAIDRHGPNIINQPLKLLIERYQLCRVRTFRMHFSQSARMDVARAAHPILMAAEHFD